MKKFLTMILVLAIIFCFCGCGESDEWETKKDLSNFYNSVEESQELLEEVAEKIHASWSYAVYNDGFSGNANIAIVTAQTANQESLDRIDELDKEISETYKKLKDTDYKDVVKDVLSAYSDYYELVVNPSGSLSSFFEDKESLHKDLSSALKELSYELE